MNPEAQRIAIAEACGWTGVEPMRAAFDSPVGNPPHAPLECVQQHWRWSIPDYLNDLNAMASAEKHLDSKDFTAAHLYWKNLCGVYGRSWDGSCTWEVVFATAAQRAEAFLRAIGKWEGTP